MSSQSKPSSFSNSDDTRGKTLHAASDVQRDSAATSGTPAQDPDCVYSTPAVASADTAGGVGAAQPGDGGSPSFSWEMEPALVACPILDWDDIRIENDVEYEVTVQVDVPGPMLSTTIDYPPTPTLDDHVLQQMADANFGEAPIPYRVVEPVRNADPAWRKVDLVREWRSLEALLTPAELEAHVDLARTTTRGRQ